MTPIEALLDAVAGQKQVQYHLPILSLIVLEAEQIFNAASIGLHPELPCAPVRLADDEQEEKGLSVSELEQSCHLLEQSKERIFTKVRALAGKSA